MSAAKAVYSYRPPVRVPKSLSNFNLNMTNERKPLGPHRLAKRISRLGTETAYAVALESAKIAATGRKVYPMHIGDLNFRTPQVVVDAAKKAIDEGKTGYCPAAGIPALRDAIAQTLGDERGVKFTADNVSVQPGGKPVIGKFLMAVMNEGDEVLYPSPGYPIYESIINFHGGVCKPYTYVETADGFKLDLNHLKSLITPRTTALVYNNFQNPMGVCSSEEEMRAIAEIAIANDLMVLSDEPYFDIVFDGKQRTKSIVSLPGMQERTCLLYTFSKSFAMTGWRLGAAVGPKWLIDTINKINTNDEACTTHFVQHAGVVALTHPESRRAVKNMVLELKDRRDALMKWVNMTPGFHAFSPEATFYLFVNVTEAARVMGTSDIEEFRKVLLENTGISLCSRNHFGDPLPNDNNLYVRFAFSASPVDMINEMGPVLVDFMTKVYKQKGVQPKSKM